MGGSDGRHESPTGVREVNGRDLLVLLSSGLNALESQIDELNRINVFPVPDGDTGTNMYHTLRSTLVGVTPSKSQSIGEAAAVIADNALYGARGNSGVILAEYLRGFCGELRDRDQADTSALARAFERGAVAARAAVEEPVEGTILTVMEDAASAALAEDRTNEELPKLLEDVTEAAKRSLLTTPSLLEVLRIAGVYDAGAAGFLAILQGMSSYRDGHSAPPTESPAAEAAALMPGESRPTTDGARKSVYGYCTELLLQGSNLDKTAVRAQIGRLGDSLVVIGTPSLLRIHIHSVDPGSVLTACLKYGSLRQVSIRNMDNQTTAHHTPSRRVHPDSGSEIGIVAAVNGKGFAEIFRSLGAIVVESGGGIPGEDLIEHSKSLDMSALVLLPNKADTLLRLERERARLREGVRIAETKSMVEGIAALIAWNSSCELEENLERMNEAASEILTLEVDQRDRRFVGLLNGKGVESSPDIERFVRAAAESCDRPVELCTVYAADSVTEEESEALVAALRGVFIGAEVEAHYGGQPTPGFLVSLE